MIWSQETQDSARITPRIADPDVRRRALAHVNHIADPEDSAQRSTLTDQIAAQKQAIAELQGRP